MKKTVKNLESKAFNTAKTVKGGGFGTTAVVGSIAGVAVLNP